MKRAGGVLAGDVASRRVVDVPSERTASPGVDSATIVDGLSPVKEVTRQSGLVLTQHIPSDKFGRPTLVEAPSVDPPACYFAQGCSTKHGLWTDFFSKFRSSACTEKVFIPSTRFNVHQVHATCI